MREKGKSCPDWEWLRHFFFASHTTTYRHSSLSQSHSQHPYRRSKWSKERADGTDGRAERAGAGFFCSCPFPCCWDRLGSRLHSPCLVNGLIRCRIAGRESKHGRPRPGTVSPSRPLSRRGSARKTKVWHAWFMGGNVAHQNSLFSTLALVSELVFSVSSMLFRPSDRPVVRLSSRTVIRLHLVGYRPLLPGNQPDDKAIGDGIVARARPPTEVKKYPAVWSTL